MEWHLYKRDDPNTWPQIDCPMVVCLYYPNGKMNLWICKFNYAKNMFVREEVCTFVTEECYYAYIGYAPSGYKTHRNTKCTDDSNCRIGCCDDGYCMYDFCECEFQKEVDEYSIEEKRIWKEFDNHED